MSLLIPASKNEGLSVMNMMSLSASEFWGNTAFVLLLTSDLEMGLKRRISGLIIRDELVVSKPS